MTDFILFVFVLFSFVGVNVLSFHILRDSLLFKRMDLISKYDYPVMLLNVLFMVILTTIMAINNGFGGYLFYGALALTSYSVIVFFMFSFIVSLPKKKNL